MPGGGNEGGSTGTGGTTGTTFRATIDNNVPLPAPFTNDNNWIVYADKLEQYFLAFKIVDDNQKRAILLTSLDEYVYEKLTDLCFPEVPGSKTYKDVCAVMKENFTKQVCVFIERLRFYEAKQAANEGVNDYTARLKKLSRYCGFGNYFKDVLRDKFVCGLSRGPVFDKVCEKKGDTTFEDLLKVALAKELAVKERRAAESLDVCKIEHPKPSQSKYSKNSNKSDKMSKGNCYACGESNHLFKSCKYKEYKCKICKTTGHLAKVCKQKNKKQTQPKQNNFIDLEDESELKYVDFVRSKKQPRQNNFIDLEDESDFERLTVKYVELEVNNLSGSEADENIFTKLSIRDRQHQFEVDTGSPISACSVDFYERNFRDIPLQPFVGGLRSYNKTPIENRGFFEVEVKFKAATHKLRLVVIVNGGDPLIGRDFLRKIKQQNCHGIVNNLQCSDADIQRLINENGQLFRKELGCYKYGKVRLEMKSEAKPVFCKARPVPIAFQNEVSRQISEKVRNGILKRVDYSEWGTPLVSAPKPNGGLRVCGDYSVTVNPHLKPVTYALPLVEDLFASLNEGESFSKIDLTDAYYQLELEEDSQKLLAWSTQEGIFVPTRMPFGISPACSIFQQVISKTLQGCKGAICCMDDILITGRNRVEHLGNLSEVFKRLSDAGFTLRAEKCEFFKERVKYLGYIIDKNGLHKDPQKIEAMVNAPKPKNISELKSFVGLVNFYSRFFPNLAQVLGPIYDLLGKDKKFDWTQECDKAFELVKSVIASDKVLIHYNPKLPVRLVCDASVYGIGAAIFHVLEDNTERPIAFVSRKLSKAEKNYSTPDREALSIYFGTKRFAHYLIGRRFSLKTDHRPLLAIFGSKKGIPPMAAGRLQRWALYLANFTFDIEHIKGRDNAIADFLSRFPTEESDDGVPDVCYVNFLTTTAENLVDCEIVRKEAAKDEVIGRVSQFVREEWPIGIEKQTEFRNYWLKKDELTMENGVLMWGYRVVIPTSLRQRLLSDLHAAHSGIVKMKARARSYFWWPNIDQDIENVSRKCVQCLTNAPNPPKVPPSPWVETDAPFQRIHSDYLELRKKVFLIITDSFSKWPEVYQVTSMEASVAIRKFREYFARYGLPGLIVTDNGTQYIAKEFADFCTQNGIRCMTTASYKPQSNGQAENSVKSFKDGIRKACDDPANRNTPLETIIERYLFFYRSSTHSTTGETPHKLLFGREMSTHFDRLRPSFLKDLRSRIEQRINEDRHRKNPVQRHFNVNDEVMLKVFGKNKSSWQRGIVKKRLGVNMYLCELSGGKLVKKHSDQIQRGKLAASIDSSTNNQSKPPTTLKTRSGKVYSRN
ncbi:uncharacterized protein K02A2.6-like [Bradysia coprophila]|uniref:uncharacterized protein K02A2.6-like n=1 Tax=Bradysia coprophila TaxID=38358 RepID=UPI00187DD650|nr:uncharacterized protein K02A2.6-like [Bradysia coprophila]